MVKMLSWLRMNRKAGDDDRRLGFDNLGYGKQTKRPLSGSLFGSIV